MQKNSPIVSVLMTSYNREKFIGAAIESVLSSTLQDFELIIVDDCSYDNTVEIARHYESFDSRIKIHVNEKNIGDYPNRNKAASYAKGKYLKYLDSDDIIYYYGLEVIIKYMEQFENAGFGLASVVSDEKPFPICISPEEIYLESFISKFDHFGRGPGSSIIKNETFKKLGGFSGKRMIGDTEFWLKCARYFPMVKFPFDLYWNRRHDSQESQSSYANLHYKKLRNEVYNEALSHPDCPLTKDQIREVRNAIWLRNLKNNMINLSSSFYNKISRNV